MRLLFQSGQEVVTVLGVDPGLKGGMVAIASGVQAWKLPLAPRRRRAKEGRPQGTQLDVLAFTAILDSIQGPIHVILEDPIAMPNQSILGTATTFENFGRLVGCLELKRINYELVRPQIWQSAMVQLTGIHKSPLLSSKQQARLWSDHLEPSFAINHKAHDGLIDAFLIALSAPYKAKNC